MRNSRTRQKLYDTIIRYAGRLAAVVVHLNDTYFVEQRGDQRLPGFPRLIATVQALRRHVAQSCGEDRVLVVHSGNFLGPSRLAKKDKGRTMVEMLNRVGVDFCVLGNHEYDHGIVELDARLREARFQALCANGQAPPALPVREFSLWPDAARARVAVTGIVAPSVQKAFKGGWQFTPVDSALRRFVAHTPQASFHLVLTHAERDEDRAMRHALRDSSARTYLLGGHDHDMFWVEADAEPLLMKNLANLQTIRVLLLLGGGESTVNAVHGRYATLEAQHTWPVDTPANRAALVTELPPFDAQLTRDWIEDRNNHIAAGADELPSLDSYYFTQESQIPAHALVHRLDGWPWHADLVHYQLGFGDFERAARMDDATVRQALKAASITAGTRVLRDFSGAAGATLEARESELRAGLTDFGVLVCECVRLQASADIALLNSGMFRADALLPAKLRERDVLDAFGSYDTSDAVWVFDDLDNALVDALLADNRRQVGKGAYPQVSDHRGAGSTRCRLAIAGYVLKADETIDPAYLDVFARHRNMQVPAVSKALSGEAVQKFAVLDALKHHLGTVAYPSVAALDAKRDDATEFIVLANKVSRAFHRSLGRRRLPHAQWNAAFRKMLASEEPVADAQLQQARDALRRHLRASAGPLLALRGEIINHRARFVDRLDYHAIFDAAMRGFRV